MSFLEVHPEHRAALAQLGLTSAADFLRLGGTIQGGHPDRHVLQLTVAGGRCFLKKEHRVAWRDRLAHWWRGFGWISKSTREGRLLRCLEAAGIACPRALAHGEAGGRAFLLLREETGVVELRTYLQEHPLERMALAEALGRELASMHAAGFQHRDLYSKHVLIGRTEQGWRFCFLDWQRGRQRRRLSWLQRLRDLATLDATLADILAGRRERLLCWRTYLAAQARLVVRPNRHLRQLCRLSARLQRKRRIRELRQVPLTPGQQGLIWLDGEALVVTSLFQEQMSRSSVARPESSKGVAGAAWLTMAEPAPTRNGVERIDVPAADHEPWKLVRRWTSRPWRWLISWWRRPMFPAPEFEQAATIIRLERYGIEAPRLLALGHRTLRPWQKYSFLLTQPPAGAVALHAYLATAALAERRRLLREAGRLLRCVHEAGYAWSGPRGVVWAVRPETGAVVLTSVDGLRRSTASLERRARRDLARLSRGADLSAADRLRFFLGYHASESLTQPMHQLARRLTLRRRPRHVAARERRVAG